jgi:hypothetical protein
MTRGVCEGMKDGEGGVYENCLWNRQKQLETPASHGKENLESWNSTCMLPLYMINDQISRDRDPS